MYLQHLERFRSHIMNKINTNELLSQLQVLARQAQQNEIKPVSEEKSTNQVQFSELIKNSINEVNDRQMNASDMAKAFELNESDVPLSQVMVEMQKARVSFEALKQVRNQLVDAYREIMNMPL